jgi:hypothetical protein
MGAGSIASGWIRFATTIFDSSLAIFGGLLDRLG